MNIFAAVTVLLISAFIGVLMSERVKKSEREIEQILLMSQNIMAYLESEKMQTAQIIKRLSENKSLIGLSFIKLCEENFAYNRTFYSIWEESVKKSERELTIGKEELKNLYMLGEILGEGDASTKQNALKMFETLMYESLQKAKENTKNKGGLYRSLGVLCGIGFAIIVI